MQSIFTPFYGSEWKKGQNPVDLWLTGSCRRRPSVLLLFHRLVYTKVDVLPPVFAEEIHRGDKRAELLLKLDKVFLTRSGTQTLRGIVRIVHCGLEEAIGAAMLLNLPGDDDKRRVLQLLDDVA